MGDIKTSAINIAKNISQNSSKLIKTSKLSLQLSSEESKLNSSYSEIGKKMFELYKNKQAMDMSKFIADFEGILEKQAKINYLKESLEIAKGRGLDKIEIEEVDRNLEFDSKNDSEDAGLEPIESIEFIEENKLCIVCGFSNSSIDKFCTRCGRIV